MTVPARPSRARHPAPRRSPPRRPSLVVVPGGAGAGTLRYLPVCRGRLSRCDGTRLAVTVATGLALASLVVMLTLHVALAQGQFRLEQLQQEAAREQAAYDRMRLQVAELESPARIVAAARDRLAMVAPSHVTYLTPSAAAGDSLVPETRPPRQQAASGWSTVKPHLAARAGG